jgi:hypothetical protein
MRKEPSIHIVEKTRYIGTKNMGMGICIVATTSMTKEMMPRERVLKAWMDVKVLLAHFPNFFSRPTAYRALLSIVKVKP